MTYSRHNDGKSPLHYILYFNKAFKELAEVCAMGTKKYGKHNWLRGGSHAGVMDSAMRHLAAYTTEGRLDKESRRHHLAHAAWNILALLEWDLQSLGQDDLSNRRATPAVKFPTTFIKDLAMSRSDLEDEKQITDTLAGWAEHPGVYPPPPPIGNPDRLYE